MGTKTADFSPALDEPFPLRWKPMPRRSAKGLPLHPPLRYRCIGKHRSSTVELSTRHFIRKHLVHRLQAVRLLCDQDVVEPCRDATVHPGLRYVNDFAASWDW